MPLELILKEGREKSLLRRHPWIFSGAVGVSNNNLGDLLVALGLGYTIQHPLHLAVHRQTETLPFFALILPMGDPCQTFHIDRNIQFHLSFSFLILVEH